MISPYLGGKRKGTYYDRYGRKATLFSWDNLPQLLLSHATAFLIGAAAAFAFNRLRSAASYGSVMSAASHAAAIGSPGVPAPPLQIVNAVDSPSRSVFQIWDRLV